MLVKENYLGKQYIEIIFPKKFIHFMIKKFMEQLWKCILMIKIRW
jgi:hypothetical protein